MDAIDAKVFAMLSAFTAAVIGAVKKAFPKWTDGKEELLAVVIPLVLVTLLKIAGVFKETGWDSAVVAAIGMGLAAGIGHDKIVNPLMAGKKAPAPEAK